MWGCEGVRVSGSPTWDSTQASGCPQRTSTPVVGAHSATMTHAIKSPSEGPTGRSGSPEGAFPAGPASVSEPSGVADGWMISVLRLNSMRPCVGVGEGLVPRVSGLYRS